MSKLTISPPAGAGAGAGVCAGAAAAVLRGGQLQPLHGRHLRHGAGDRLHHHPRHKVRQGELLYCTVLYCTTILATKYVKVSSLYFRWMDGGVVNMALYSTLHIPELANLFKTQEVKTKNKPFLICS